MTQNYCPVNVNTLTSEERTIIFLDLITVDPSLPRVLTSEQRQRLYTILVAIDPSIEALPNAGRAIAGIVNTQVSL